MKNYQACSRPISLEIREINSLTGEIFNPRQVEKRCGTRRSDLCQPCSEIWKDDAYYALRRGAEKHGKDITFITFAAPGSKVFGKTHSITPKDRPNLRCACRRWHRHGDDLVGTPIKPGEFEYKAMAKFDASASRLAAITMQKIWRLRAHELGVSVKEAKLPFARVIEWQAQGAAFVVNSSSSDS